MGNFYLKASLASASSISDFCSLSRLVVQCHLSLQNNIEFWYVTKLCRSKVLLALMSYNSKIKVTYRNQSVTLSCAFYIFPLFFFKNVWCWQLISWQTTRFSCWWKSTSYILFAYFQKSFRGKNSTTIAKRCQEEKDVWIIRCHIVEQN